MKGYTKLIGEKGNIHMENIPDQEEVEYPIKEDLWNTESNICLLYTSDAADDS